MTDIEKTIQARVNAFVEELSELVRQAALERLSDALGTTPATKSRKGAATAAAPKIARRRKGAKRSPEQMEALSKSIVKLITSKPGIRADQIAAELAIETKETALPIKGLLAEKVIVKKGQKRATSYFVKGK